MLGAQHLARDREGERRPPGRPGVGEQGVGHVASAATTLAQMSATARMRAWGASVSCAHLTLATLGWLVLGVPPWFFTGCAILTLAVTLLAAPLMGGRPGGGGGGPRPDPEPEPPWWPGFERDFRTYAERRGRGPASARRSLDAGSRSA